MKTVFKGWMFASNPSVSALEHPVYDIWVKDVSGEEFDGDIPQTETVDEETSDRIDDLIDQLMDQSANEMESPDNIEIIENKARLQDVSTDSPTQNSGEW